MMLKDLKFDESGTTGARLPGGEYMEVSVVFDPENPIENKFSVTVLKPPTAMDTSTLLWVRDDLHPLQAQALIVHLTSGGSPDVWEGDNDPA
jgi:hypothetical protein